MALLNPSQIRLSVMTLMVAYLSELRGQHADFDHMIDALAPPSLSQDGSHQLDARQSTACAIELGLVVRDGDQIKLGEAVRPHAKAGAPAIARIVRGLVFAEALNKEPWGSQIGARDLTNALAWFLTFPATTAPARMEGEMPSAQAAQEADFGPRQSNSRGELDDDSGGWPISNANRWISFQRWACSLGFAWRTSTGRLVPDPTPAIRDAMATVFAKDRELPAREFVNGLGYAIPVLEMGRYRQFVADNWRRPAEDPYRLTSSTTDGLERLVAEGLLSFDDRADAPRINRSDGSTFSHVRLEAGR